jgi:Xaa-Pro aminopeptidase
MLLCAASSLAIHDAVPAAQKVVRRSPVSMWKALKNDAELEGMRQAHLRDAVALVNYFVWLENGECFDTCVQSNGVAVAKCVGYTPT